MTDTYRPGDLVDITVKGARVVAYETPHDDPPFLTVCLPNMADRTLIPVPWNGVTVERVAPPEWPPQRADVWRDRHGARWFAVSLGSDIDMCGDGGSRVSPQHLLEDAAPLSLSFRATEVPS